MVRHDHNSMQMDSCCGTCGAGALARERQNPAFSQAMLNYKIPRLLRQDPPPARTEGDEQGSISLLQMRKPPPISVFGKNCRVGSYIHVE